MIDKNQISALLGVSIIPQIVVEINKFYDNEEEAAPFYRKSATCGFSYPSFPFSSFPAKMTKWAFDTLSIGGGRHQKT